MHPICPYVKFRLSYKFCFKLSGPIDIPIWDGNLCHSDLSLPFSSYFQLNISSILLLLILLVVRIEWLQCKCKACWPMLERYRHTDLWAIVNACTNYICRYLNSIWQTCKWLNVHAAVRTITVQYQYAIMSQQDKSLSVYHSLLEITHTKSLFQFIKIKNLLAAPLP